MILKKLITLLIQLVYWANCGHIYSWDISVDYDYDGKPEAYNLIFALESGLGPNEFLKIFWPFNLG